MGVTSMCTRGARDSVSRGRSTAALGGMRTFLAFLTAPLVIAIGWAAQAFLLADSDPRPLSDLAGEFLVTVVMVYIGAAWVTVLFALPLFFLLRRFRLLRSWTAGLVGALIGGIIGAALGNLASPPGSLWFVALGGLAGFVFWLVGGFNLQRQETYAQGR
jgi:hypothetical protein